jgi:hypothetical protein
MLLTHPEQAFGVDYHGVFTNCSHLYFGFVLVQALETSHDIVPGGNVGYYSCG